MTGPSAYLVGAFLGVLYAVGMILRDQVVPGLVGGVLAGILCVLVLREMAARQRRRGGGGGR